MRNVLAVFVGGLLGTGIRVTLDTVIHHDDSQFPWSTLIINVVGSFVLAFLVARVWPSAPHWLRFGLGTGVIGSFTTFSALIVSLVSLTAANELALAVVYLVVSLVIGFGAAAVGLRLGSRVDPELEPGE